MGRGVLWGPATYPPNGMNSIQSLRHVWEPYTYAYAVWRGTMKFGVMVIHMGSSVFLRGSYASYPKRAQPVLLIFGVPLLMTKSFEVERPNSAWKYIRGGACFRGSAIYHRIGLLHKCVARFVSGSWVSCDRPNHHNQICRILVYGKVIVEVLFFLQLPFVVMSVVMLKYDIISNEHCSK